MMYILDPTQQEIELRGLHKNVQHRTLIDGDSGAQSITLWEHHTPPGAGAPPHIHPHEETITVLSGHIKAKIGDTIVEATQGQTLFIPAETRHTFGAIGEETAHLLIMFPVGHVTWERV